MVGVSQLYRHASVEDAAVMLQYFRAGKSTRDIAWLFNCDESVVYNALARARG